MFNERKVAQMAAYLLDKHSGTMSHLKLMKLLYLSDRAAMSEFGSPISGDRFVSMPHGPILTMTLNHMDGDVESSPDGWDLWVSDKENNEISLKQKISSRQELDELSDAEIDILEKVWDEFGHMGKWEIRDYTHDHCSEWHDPNGSSYPIAYKEVFHALGRSDKEAERLSAEIEDEHTIERIFAAL